MQGARHHAGSLVLIALAFLAASCVGPEASSSSPGASPSISRSPSAPPALRPSDWLRLGQVGVGNLGCNGQELAWTTQSIGQAKGNDEIEIATSESPHPHVVARASHGGTLIDDVPITGEWLVYLEYQQKGQSDFTNFWYLNAVNWQTGAVIKLAQATSGIGLSELPWYDAEGGRAVWNQVDTAGNEVLHLYDFEAGQSSRLNLPASMSPFEPAIFGSQVVFVDNATDPNRAQEDFLSRRGSLRSLDLTSGRVSTLDQDPTAFSPRVANGDVVWTVVSSGFKRTVALVPVAGGKITVVGGLDPITPQTNGSIVIWYDFASLHFMAFGVKAHRVVQLQVGSFPDVRSVFALCGTELYFALPPAVDGGSSTIRAVDLGSLSIS